MSFPSHDPPEAQGGASADAHELMNHIEQNPLVGKAYQVWGQNGFTPKASDETTFNVNTIGNRYYGEFEFESGDFTGNQQQQVARPVSRHYWKKCSHTTPVHVNPGQFKTSKVESSFSIPLSNFLRKLRGILEDTYSYQTIYLGSAKMYGLEKSMHTDSNNEPNLKVASDIHGFCGVYITYSNQTIMPVYNSATVTGSTPL